MPAFCLAFSARYSVFLRLKSCVDRLNITWTKFFSPTIRHRVPAGAIVISAIAVMFHCNVLKIAVSSANIPYRRTLPLPRRIIHFAAKLFRIFHRYQFYLHFLASLFRFRKIMRGFIPGNFSWPVISARFSLVFFFFFSFHRIIIRGRHRRAFAFIYSVSRSFLPFSLR